MVGVVPSMVGVVAQRVPKSRFFLLPWPRLEQGPNFVPSHIPAPVTQKPVVPLVPPVPRVPLVPRVLLILVLGVLVLGAKRMTIWLGT